MVNIVRKRNSGKTHILLHGMVLNANMVLVSYKEKYARQKFVLAKKLDLDIDKERFVGAYDIMKLKRLKSSGCVIAVDDIDMIISRDIELALKLLELADIVTASEG